MRILYTKPELVDLSQGSRIAFARQFRFMTQDDVSDKLGLTGECKRRTMTRYEKGNRNPKDDRTSEIAKILDININAIKKYDYKEPIDLLYTLMWLEELIPKYQIDISKVPKAFPALSVNWTLHFFSFLSITNCQLYPAEFGLTKASTIKSSSNEG